MSWVLRLPCFFFASSASAVAPPGKADPERPARDAMTPRDSMQLAQAVVCNIKTGCRSYPNCRIVMLDPPRQRVVCNKPVPNRNYCRRVIRGQYEATVCVKYRRIA